MPLDKTLFKVLVEKMPVEKASIEMPLDKVPKTNCYVKENDLKINTLPRCVEKFVVRTNTGTVLKTRSTEIIWFSDTCQIHNVHVQIIKVPSHRKIVYL